MIMSIFSAGVNVNVIELYLKHSAQILWLESMQKVSSIEVRQALHQYLLIFRSYLLVT